MTELSSLVIYSVKSALTQAMVKFLVSSQNSWLRSPVRRFLGTDMLRVLTNGTWYNLWEPLRDASTTVGLLISEVNVNTSGIKISLRSNHYPLFGFGSPLDIVYHLSCFASVLCFVKWALMGSYRSDVPPPRRYRQRDGAGWDSTDTTRWTTHRMSDTEESEDTMQSSWKFLILNERQNADIKFDSWTWE